MTADLHLLPLYRRDGTDLTEPLPGLFLATPPRKAVRSRQSDQLLLHLTFTGTATLKSESQDQLIQRLTDTYYQTSGAATSALRALVESLNAALLARNLRAEGRGLQAAGLLTVLILRPDQVLIGQSGPTHVYLIEKERYRHLFDPQTAGHGLGLGRTTGLLTHYIPNEPGTLILLSPAPPQAWDTPALHTAHGRPLRTIQRGLLKPAGPDLNALLIEIREGPGKILLHTAPLPDPVPRQSLPAEPKSHIESEAEAGPDPEPEPEPEPPLPAPETPLAEQEAPLVSEIEPPSAEDESQAEEPPQEEEPQTEKVAAPPPVPRQPRRRRPSPVGPALLTIGRAARNALGQLGEFLRSILTRLLPGNELFTIPSSTMAFIAIAVPILLVIAAFFIYQQRGQRARFTTYLQYAEAAKTNAQGQTAPEDLRTAWNAVLFYVDQAEAYQTTPETQALRQEAHRVLDQMDSVTRIGFIPVLQTPLGDNVTVHKMAASNDNAYLLNKDAGNVVRVWQSGRGYETDLTFRCGPLPNESLIVGPLVDIAVLPPVNYLDAQVMGMDANGILVYCLHDETPIPVPLFPPDSNWGRPVAFALDNDILYVLDPQTNAVWVYYGDDSEFSGRPRLFFDENVPPMADVIDLAVDRGALYLLHEDGHITTCTFGFDVQPTRCIDPAPFTDPRAGREGGAFIAGASFEQIVFTPPPDPSIFLLDPLQQAIYHLSLRLTLQRQYRPQVVDGPPSTLPVTAFAISPNRLAYLAFGNEVWVASLP